MKKNIYIRVYNKITFKRKRRVREAGVEIGPLA